MLAIYHICTGGSRTHLTIANKQQTGGAQSRLDPLHERKV
jgi:hypothetical protein